MSDAARVPIAPRTCKQGHLIEGHNAAPVRHPTGRVYILCRQCRYDAVKRTLARKRGEQVAMQVARDTEPESRTLPVWRALPKDIQQRVAGVLIDPAPPDPLVAAVIRRAANVRVWNRIGTSFATIALIEALIEESRESESSRLRIDRLLAVILP